MSSTRTYILVCIVAHLLGTALFYKGFFPVKKAVPGFAEWKNYSPLSATNTQPNAVFSRLVFVLIDALRADFALPMSSAHKQKLDFIHRKVANNETISFLAKAQPPTVTMPRIKALTSGGIPGFVDVVLNFDSKSLTEDNLITQLHREGKRIVFYGDDTWLRLFPNHFIRSDGTTSFFVTDYTEVDYNVTRHLEKDLSTEPDWDVMILHYLGLDHIGHLAGPHSQLVGPKLAEMDQIMTRLYRYLETQDVRDGQSSLLVVCGDHGMSDQGSHGGATYSETATPYIMLSPTFSKQRGRHFDELSTYQIDMVPSLSLLLGLPIPQNSLGILPETLISGLKSDEMLQWLHINSQQLMNVFKTNEPTWKSTELYRTYIRITEQHAVLLSSMTSATTNVTSQLQAERLAHQYRALMVHLRDRVAQALSSYDIHAMVLAIIISILTLLSLLKLNVDKCAVPTLPVRPAIAIVFVSACALFGHVTVCTSIHGSALLCSTTLPAFVINGYVFAAINISVSLLCSKNAHQLQASKGQTSVVHKYLITMIVFHTVSLLSSSYIEEEHQVWYFFTQSLVLYMVIYFLTKRKTQLQTSKIEDKCSRYDDIDAYGRRDHEIRKEMYDSSVRELETNVENKRYMSSVSESLRRRDKLNYSASANTTKNNDYYNSEHDFTHRYIENHIVLAAIFMAFLGLLGRRWNQTGDKWAHLPDIGDWLVRPENKVYLSVTFVTSLITACVFIDTKSNPLQRLLFCAGACCVYCFRAANGDVLLPGIYGAGHISQGIFEARLAYLFSLLVFLSFLPQLFKYSKHPDNQNSGIDRKENSKSDKYKDWKHAAKTSKLELLCRALFCSFSLISILLMRPHNVSVIAMEIVRLRIVGCIVKCLPHIDVTTVTLLYLSLGQAAFFHQGNSNSISTVDVSAGYVGVADYWPPLIGLLMALSTYSGPIVWHLGLVITLCQVFHKEKMPSVIEKCASTLLLCRQLPVTVYLMLVTSQRYHLFVWTVFSPKLLYEGMTSLVMCVAIILMLLFERILR